MKYNELYRIVQDFFKTDKINIFNSSQQASIKSDDESDVIGEIEIGRYDEESPRMVRRFCISRCIDSNKQKDYEHRVVQANLHEKRLPEYNELLVLRVQPQDAFCDPYANIIYVSENDIYNIDNDTICLVYCSEYDQVIKMKGKLGINAFIDTDEPVVWLDQITDITDIYKNPLNQKYWDEVYFRQPKYQYWGDCLFIIPGFTTGFIKMNDYWIKTPVEWLENNLHNLPKEIQNEFDIWRNLNERNK